MSPRSLKILTAFLILTFLVAGAAVPIMAAPPAQGGVPCEEEVIVVEGDWLSKLADQYYGNVLAYPAIFEATNAAAYSDDRFDTLQDPSVIEVGQRLCIPSPEDAEMLMRKWNGLEPSAEGCTQIELQDSASAVSPKVPYSITNKDFVDGEVILTGLDSDIQLIFTDETGRIEDDLAKWELIATISFERLGRQEFGESGAPLRFPPEQINDLTMNLYRVGAGETVRSIEAFYNIARGRMDRLQSWVYAEPNYLTNLPISSAADWDPGGSPLHGVDGAPAITATAFYDQWGLGVVSGTHVMGPSGRTVDTYGDGTQIIVLDTSMFYQPGLWEFKGPRWSEEDAGAQAMLSLCVSHPMPVHPLTPTQTYSNVSRHGVFVAGLAHAVAPHSRIHVVRVLNDQGHGTIFWLADTLIEVIRDVLQAPTTDEYQDRAKNVINLSLGIHPPNDPKEVGISDADLDFIRTQTDAISATMPAEAQAIMAGLQPNDTDRVPIVALETPLALAYSHGAVIVAAAGNESAQSPSDDPEQALRPARYPTPFVIGVAASNQALGRSCYSNKGDIAAPGGGRDPGQQPPPNCTSEVFENGLNTCGAEGDVDCPYGVVSHSPSVTTTGYAIWPGTSFAAPQVSGLAALLLERGVPAQEVFDAMRTTTVTDTNLGRGIIDVDQSLP